MSRAHWRSLGQLEGSPEARAFLEREFPEGASFPPDAISRRHVLTLLGASVSLAGFAACTRALDAPSVAGCSSFPSILVGRPSWLSTTRP